MDPVTIRKAGSLLQVIPPCESVLASVLSCRRRKQTGPRGSDAVYVHHQLYKLKSSAEVPRWLEAPAGLLARICATLRRQGIPYTFTDVRPLQLEEPDWTQLDTPRPGQDVILAKIATCDRGQIVAPTGDGKSWLITQVCKIYRKSNIIIAVPAISIAKTLRDRLLLILPSVEVGQVGGGRREADRRVTVAVRNSLLKTDMENCDILLYDECHTAGGEVTSIALSAACDSKVFGFTASPEMRGDKADLIVEALFGPIIHETSYQESVQHGNIVPIEVTMRSVAGEGAKYAGMTGQRLDRHALWRNKYRNSKIAEDARIAAEAGEQVLVVAATVEHALELYSLLKDQFALVYASMDRKLRLRYEKRGVLVPGEHPLTPETRTRMQEEFERGELRRVIATNWNQGVSFDNLNTLIRADGRSSNERSVQVPGRLSRLSEGKKAGKLIDYLDQFNETLHRRAKARARMYRSMGWQLIMPRRADVDE